jgi:Na+/proline symporter
MPASSVTTFAWAFLAGYVLLMLGLGYRGYRQTDTQDDYATARGGFGFLLLSLAYAATAASGSTFMGMPGMAYDMGFKVGYYAILYPIGAYIGMLLVARITKKVGDQFGSQSVPDFLGDRYQSPLLRVMAALVALFLLFYVMSQITAAGWLFDTILGVDYGIGIWLAGALLLLYLTAGGTYADILTDGVQGAVMIAITGLITVMFVTGWGVDGGMVAVNAALPSHMQWDVHTSTRSPTFASEWAIFLLLVAHIGFTALPHLGNKFFAIKSTQYMKKFMLASAVIGIMLPLMFLGGIVGRAMDVQVQNPDAILPVMFMQTLPPVVAAFLCVAILSAIVSTADGLIIAISQIFANDLYRKTYVPLQDNPPAPETVEQRSLWISRIATVGVTVAAVAAVQTPPEYLAVLLWVGIGGIIASYGGPYLVGTLREETSKTAAITAFVAGFGAFFVLHLGPRFGLYEGWFPYNENPFAASGIGFMLSCSLTYVVSKITESMPDEHLNKVFRTQKSS